MSLHSAQVAPGRISQDPMIGPRAEPLLGTGCMLDSSVPWV